MKRLLFLAVLLSGPMGAVEAPASEVRARLSARIRETLLPPPVAPAATAEPEAGEPVLVLEPMVVTAAMESDLLAEARRAAEARKAREFSLLKGGLLFSTGRTDVGFWAKLVPIDDTPVKKGGVGIRIDLLRVKW